MQALRQRAACVARRSPRSIRSYASDSHGHHHEAPKVEEGLGTAFYVFAGAIPASYLFYSASRPGADGSPSSLSKWLGGFTYLQEEDAAINMARTVIMEQAANDKHLLMYADGGRKPHVELKTPELLFSGSPWNVPAGHRARTLDEVTEHYRQQYHAEEERKAQKLAAKAEKS